MTDLRLWPAVAITLIAVGTALITWATHTTRQLRKDKP